MTVRKLTDPDSKQEYYEVQTDRGIFAVVPALGQYIEGLEKKERDWANHLEGQVRFLLENYVPGDGTFVFPDGEFWRYNPPRKSPSGQEYYLEVSPNGKAVYLRTKEPERWILEHRDGKWTVEPEVPDGK